MFVCVTSERGGGEHVHGIDGEYGGSDILEAGASSSVQTEPPLGTAEVAGPLVEVPLPSQPQRREVVLLPELHLHTHTHTHTQYKSY